MLKHRRGRVGGHNRGKREGEGAAGRSALREAREEDLGWRSSSPNPRSQTLTFSRRTSVHLSL